MISRRTLHLTILLVGLACNQLSGQVYESIFPENESTSSPSWFSLESELTFGGPNPEGNNTFSVFGGWSYPDYRDSFGTNWFPSTRLTTGSAFGIAAGKRIGPRLRSEFEFSWRRNELEPNYSWRGYLLTPVYTSQLEGEINTYSGMYNLLFDFDRAENRLLTPYAGVGIGLSYIDTDASWMGRGETVSNETAFSYQAIGGVSLKVAPAADFFVEYRYFATDSQSFNQPEYRDTFNTYNEQEFYHSFQSQQLLMGLRVRF